MSEIVRKGKEFVGYEYKEISVPEYLSSLYLDAYPCFGWETDSHLVEKKDEKIKSGYVNVRDVYKRQQLRRQQKSIENIRHRICHRLKRNIWKALKIFKI